MPQDNFNNKFRNPYNAAEIAKIKKAFKKDGRYEKKRRNKKSDVISKARFGSTLQDLFPGKEDNRPILKIGDDYFVIFEKLGVGELGKVKWGLNLDTNELYLLKTQETFGLAAQGLFDPRKIKLQKNSSTLYPLVKELAKKNVESEEYRKGLYALHVQLIEFLNEKGDVDDGYLQYITGALPDYNRNANGEFEAVDEERFNDYVAKKKTFIQKAVATTASQTPSLEQASSLESESDKFANATEIVKRRAELELQALKALGRGKGEVIIRNVERKIKNTELNGEDVQFNILIEYMPGDTLTAVIDENSLDQIGKMKIATGIIEEWLKLSEAGFYHCDLNPDNIKYDRDTGEVKLIDFGGVAYFDRETRTALFPTLGSPFYADAERGHVSGQQKPATEASEVFALGIMLAELFNYAAFDASKGTGQIIWNKMENTNDPIYLLIQEMTHKDRNSRPLMKEALEKMNQLMLSEVEDQTKVYKLIFDELHNIPAAKLTQEERKLREKFSSHNPTQNEETIKLMIDFFKKEFMQHGQPGKSNLPFFKPEYKTRDRMQEQFKQYLEKRPFTKAVGMILEKVKVEPKFSHLFVTEDVTRYAATQVKIGEQRKIRSHS